MSFYFEISHPGPCRPSELALTRTVVVRHQANLKLIDFTGKCHVCLQNKSIVSFFGEN